MAPPPRPSYDPSGVQHHTIPSFTFTNGTKIPNLTVAYKSINPSSPRKVLIPTCFSGWINTTLTFTSSSSSALSSYNVIVAAMLSNGESSSPSNNPLFPDPGQLHYEDVIRAHHHLLTQGLGIETLDAVIGFSMGGQQAYHWAVMYPDFVKSIVSICSSARTSPHNYAFLEGPIASLSTSVDYVAWREGKDKVKAKASSEGDGGDRNYLADLDKPERGLKAFGRTYSAWLTSAEWFRQGEWRDLGFESVEEWISRQGEGKLGWDADDLLCLARMWQMGDIGKTAKGEVGSLGWEWNETDGDGDLKKALQGIRCPVLLMPCRTDQYFRPSESEFEMGSLEKGRLEVIESVWGHVAGGGGCADDVAFMDEKIKSFLGEISQ